MPTTIRARLLAVLTLSTLLAHMSGCLAYEVRNELRQINTSLEDVKLKLNSVNDGLLKLERTNTLLSDLDIKLTSLETTNASLASIDAHLASLRRTLNNIDSTIPFLKVSGDDKDSTVETAEEKPAREAGEQPAEPTPEPAPAPAPPG